MKKILLLLIAILSVSCGSRKVERTTVRVEEKTSITNIDSLDIKTNFEEKCNDTTSIYEVEITPIDSTKKMVINGKEYHNVRYKKSKVKKGISTSIKKDSVLKQLKIGHIEHTAECLKDDKKSDKVQINWWLIIIISVSAILFFALKPKSTK